METPLCGSLGCERKVRSTGMCNTHLKQRDRYGITPGQYESLVVAQCGVCAICGEPESALGNTGEPRTLSVDHDHITGDIRGLLCLGCNVALGHFQDRPLTLIAAMRYLKV